MATKPKYKRNPLPRRRLRGWGRKTRDGYTGAPCYEDELVEDDYGVRCCRRFRTACVSYTEEEREPSADA